MADVAWTEAAIKDLADTAQYIARDSTAYASAFVERVRSESSRLATAASIHQLVPEIGDPAIRETLVGKYRLIYHIGDTTVTILALVHGARDMRAYWKRDPPHP